MCERKRKPSNRLVNQLMTAIAKANMMPKNMLSTTKSAP